jgi:hypothetical protein
MWGFGAFMAGFKKLPKAGKNVKITKENSKVTKYLRFFGSVAQWIEQCSSKALMLVRFQPGPP